MTVTESLISKIINDFCNKICQKRSFNHFISQLLEMQRHVEVEGLGDLEIDEVLESGRLLYRNFPGADTFFQYLVNKNCCAVTRGNVIRPIGHQRPGIECFSRIGS